MQTVAFIAVKCYDVTVLSIVVGEIDPLKNSIRNLSNSKKMMNDSRKVRLKIFCTALQISQFYGSKPARSAQYF